MCNKCNLEIKKYYELKIDNYENDISKNFKEHIYIFKYGGPIREELIKYKFDEKSYSYKMFANLFLKDEKIKEKIKEYDLIIPVPISKSRLKQRGYNQTELIAKDISRKTKIDYIKNVLYKKQNNVPQSSLNREQRQMNAKGMYEIKNQDLIYNKSILIFDDIYTTGSTVNECSKVLMKAKPKEIGVITIAKD